MSWKGDNIASQVGRVAIVTGANIGLGYETALALAKNGAEVILACRNVEKADAAKAKIIAATGNEKVHVQVVDLSSLASVKAFAEQFN